MLSNYGRQHKIEAAIATEPRTSYAFVSCGLIYKVCIFVSVCAAIVWDVLEYSVVEATVELTFYSLISRYTELWKFLLQCFH